MDKKKVRKEEMDPHQLHKYLCENLADIEHLISRETLFSKTSSEQEIVDRLQKGVRNLKRQDSQTLMIYIQFGNFLNLAKSWVEGEKKEGKINQSWAVWLKEKTGYSDDHARKLRCLASALYGYPQFFYVGLPLNFILKKLKDITAMLQVPEYNAFWKQAVVLVPTLQLQQSQDTSGQPPLDVHTVDASTVPLTQSQDDESL